MKKVLTLLLCFTMLLSLCACGSKEEPEANQPPVVEDPQPSNDPQPSEDPAPSDDPLPSEEIQDPVDLAKSFIDQPLAELIAVFGEPESSDYAPSCMGDGEDGLLIYDGFVVYTYREGDSETVYDVE